MEISTASEQQLAQNTAANLKRLREEHGFTLDQACERLGELGLPMKKATLSKVENGDRKVMLSEAFVFARLYGVPVEALGHASGVQLSTKAKQLVEQFASTQDQLDELNLRKARLAQLTKELTGEWALVGEQLRRSRLGLQRYMHRHRAEVEEAFRYLQSRTAPHRLDELNELGPAWLTGEAQDPAVWVDDEVPEVKELAPARKRKGSK